MDYIDEELASILGQDFFNSLSPVGSDSSSSSPFSNVVKSSTATTLRTKLPCISLKPPAEAHNHISLSNFSVLNDVDGISFTNVNSPEKIQSLSEQSRIPDEHTNISEAFRNERSSEPRNSNSGKRKSRVRPPSQTYDHIIAERKRREQLSQQFVALSALIPGLKKMDKSSVLGNAIKYMKHLQEKLKTLEEQAAKQEIDSVVRVKKSRIMIEDEGPFDETTSFEQPLPEIEARVCNRSILLKIHCKKCKGILVKILTEIEKLNIAVVSTSGLQFGNVALEFTVVGEMEKEFDLMVEDVVRVLRSALRSGC